MQTGGVGGGGGAVCVCVKDAYELLNLRALKISVLHETHIFQSMGKIFCVKFQRLPVLLY